MKKNYRKFKDLPLNSRQ